MSMVTRLGSGSTGTYPESLTVESQTCNLAAGLSFPHRFSVRNQ